MKMYVTTRTILAAIAALTLALPALVAAPRHGHTATRVGTTAEARYGAALLLPRNSKSSATGALVITPDITGLRLGLSVAHLRPRTTYNALIYAGACGPGAPGTAHYMLPDLTTDSRGNALLATKLSASSVARDWSIDVPLKQMDETKTPGPGVICGAIYQAGVEVDLRPPEASGAADPNHALVTRHITPQGTVDMSRTLGTEVAVYAETLAPRTAYTVGIIGSHCGGPSALKYRLSAMQSNDSGQAVSVTYLSGSLSQTDLSINVQDARGHVAICGNLPGYGLTQPAYGP